MKRFPLCCAVLIAFLPIHSFSQGCSDAGFCTLAPSDSNAVGLSISATTSYEVGDGDVIYMIPQLEAQYTLNEKSSLSIRVPYVTLSGVLGDNQGLGDLIVNYSRKVLDRYVYDAHLILGVRIAAGDASHSSENPYLEYSGLPMAYQTSLVTYDFIAVSTFRYLKWHARLGAQVPILNNNQNSYSSFIPGHFIDGNANPIASAELDFG